MPTAESALTDQPAAAPLPRTRTIVLAIAAPVIVYLIAHALLLSRFPWFIDETIFAEYAQRVQGDKNGRFVALVDHKGLVNTWIGAVLIQLGASPMLAMRLISVAAGLVTAVATGLLVRSWRGPRDAYFAFVLTLFVPYLFVHGAVGVYDEFIAAGSMVALALQLSLARRPRLDRAMLLGVTFGLLLLSKPTGALAIALIPFSLALFDWRAEGLRTRLAAWVGATALALFIGGAMYALTRLSALAYSPAPDNHRTVGDLLSDPFASVSLIMPDVIDAMIGYITAPVLVVALWGCWRVAVDRDRVGLVLMVWAGAAVAAYLLLTDRAFPRYGLQAAAPICALAVYGGVDLWGRVAQRRSTGVAWAVTALVLLPLVVLNVRVVVTPESAPYPGLDHDQYVLLVSNRQSAREAAELILERSPEQFTPQTPQRDRTVAMLGGWTNAALLVLNGERLAAEPRFLVADSVGAINNARFVILEGMPPMSGLDVKEADLVRTWQRGENGVETKLYDRGAGPEPR